MVSEAGDDPRAAGRALLMQVINAGDADVGSGGGVDAGGRRLHQRQPHRVAPQQHQTHPGLVYLDLEPKHLTKERGGGRKIVNLQDWAGSSKTRSPPHAMGTQVAHQRASPLICTPFPIDCLAAVSAPEWMGIMWPERFR